MLFLASLELSATQLRIHRRTGLIPQATARYGADGFKSSLLPPCDGSPLPSIDAHAVATVSRWGDVEKLNRCTHLLGTQSRSRTEVELSTVSTEKALGPSTLKSHLVCVRPSEIVL